MEVEKNQTRNNVLLFATQLISPPAKENSRNPKIAGAAWCAASAAN